jgi:hypothetical protein
VIDFTDTAARAVFVVVAVVTLALLFIHNDRPRR